jgi:hypothetical protein
MELQNSLWLAVAAPDLEVGAVTAFCSRGRFYGAAPDIEI